MAGGYIAGKKELVEMVSYRLTTPGIGKECGLTFGTTRNVLQGFFMAPYIVSQALMGAIYCARMFEKMGYYELFDNKNDIEYAYYETEKSLTLAELNLETAKTSPLNVLTECQQLLDEVKKAGKDSSEYFAALVTDSLCAIKQHLDAESQE